MKQDTARIMTKRTIQTPLTLALAASGLMLTLSAHALPVPGYVPPVELTQAPAYADDTRGVYVPEHAQHRLKTAQELALTDITSPPQERGVLPVYAADNMDEDAYERQLNEISGYQTIDQEIDRLANEGQAHLQPMQPVQQAPVQEYQIAQGYNYGSQPPYTEPYPQAQQPYVAQPQPVMPMGQNPVYAQGMQQPMMQPAAPEARRTADGGLEIATGSGRTVKVDMGNALVRLNEDRVSIRRAVQRMMDQIGAGDWSIGWDLSQANAALPDEEISIRAEEPFMNVLNALLGRMQARSGVPLRAVRYDQQKRLVITDRTGQAQQAETAPENTAKTVDVSGSVAVTEQVLKESMVTLHYDMIPLVDALENIVNQAGKGEWRLRIYAGKEKVLEPAHIEEPFNVAMDRLLKLFNLKYEIFPGGKLIVVTHNSRFGYRGQ